MTELTRGTSSVARKNWMAATGLFLCVFLVVHVLGNVPLLFPGSEGRLTLNSYADTLSHWPVIEIASVVTLACVALHAVQAALLSRRAVRAAGKRPSMAPRTATSDWASRCMGLSGTLVLVFLVVHLWDFWYPYKFRGSTLGTDTQGHRDLYGLVGSVLANPAHSLLYVASLLALGVHLQHGWSSAARSLGLWHGGASRWAERLGWWFALCVTLAFVAMTAVTFARGAG